MIYLIAIVLAPILIKCLWVNLAMTGVGSMVGEKGTSLIDNDFAKNSTNLSFINDKLTGKSDKLQATVPHTRGIGKHSC